MTLRNVPPPLRNVMNNHITTLDNATRMHYVPHITFTLLQRKERIMSKTQGKTRKTKSVSFSAICVKYAQDHDINDVSVAAKRLRAKLRGAYGKHDVVTSYVDRKGENRDGNRYPDATAPEAKALLSL